MNNENKPVYFTKDQLKQHLTSRGITDNAKAQPVVDGLIARGAVIEGINETPNLAQSVAGSFIKPATDIIGTGFAGIGALGSFAGKKLAGQDTTLSQEYANQTEQVQQSGADSIVKPLTGQQIRPAQSLEQLGGDVLQTAALAIPAGSIVKGASTAANIGRGLGYGALAGGTFGAGSQMSENATLEDVIKGGLFGAALGGAVGGVLPAIPAIYGAAKKAPAVVTDVFTGAKGLRADIQTYLGKQNVAPQLETSVNRLTGTAGRMESPTALYNEYFPLAEKALTDIKVDAPISKIGSEIGDAFKSVIDNRRAVGAVMGQELKTVGKLKTDIEPIFANFETALNEAGLTYNGLTKKMVASDLAKVAPEDIRIIEDFVGELNRIGTKPSVAQIDALISRVTDKINYAKSASGMTSTTNGERLIKATLNSLRNTFDEIPELANYAKARKTYSELSDFIDEGSGFLGKVTQSGDFAKDASLAKSAVQSILNNGKKDWLLKLEGLTDYPALDKSTLALQAMKDAGDFRGLSLLETLSDGAKTMTPSGITSKVFDWAFEKGARTVGGTPAERTRAFLQRLESESLKNIPAQNITKNVTTPTNGPKTNPTQIATKKSNSVMTNTIPQKVKGASGKLISDESYQETLKEFKKNIGNMNSGIDPVQVARAIKLASYHVQEGIIAFADLSTRLAQDGIKLTKEMYNNAIQNAKLTDDQFIRLMNYKNDSTQANMFKAREAAQELGLEDKFILNKEKFMDWTNNVVSNQEARQGLIARTKTPAIPKELQPLAEEARKYKSAEEFVNKVDITKTPEFKKWAGKNKVVEAYHGTPNEFSSFKTGNETYNTSGQPTSGISFADNYRNAEPFSRQYSERYNTEYQQISDKFKKLYDEAKMTGKNEDFSNILEKLGANTNKISSEDASVILRYRGKTELEQVLTKDELNKLEELAFGNKEKLSFLSKQKEEAIKKLDKKYADEGKVYRTYLKGKIVEMDGEDIGFGATRNEIVDNLAPDEILKINNADTGQYIGTEYMTNNPDNVYIVNAGKTKQQLIDLWNKANGKN